MLDIISKFFLAFARAEVLIPLSLFGYIFHDKNKWVRIIYIMLFGTILVTYLKSIWQIPLAPWVKSDGWSFPSGHMFVACVFYLQISREMQKRWVTNLVYIILLGEAYGLVHQKYHIMRDVAGALGFAIVTLYLYNMLTKRPFFQNRPESLIIVLLPLSLILTILLPITQPHVIYSLAGLVGFALVALIYKKFAIMRQNKI